MTMTVVQDHYWELPSITSSTSTAKPFDYENENCLRQFRSELGRKPKELVRHFSRYFFP